MSCSGSNTNKESLINLCESDMIVSGASSSQTNQTEACDTFITRKVSPRTDSENTTNYSKHFLPTPNRLIQQTTFHPEFNSAQKMKFSIKDFFSKCDQSRRKLRIWTHLLEKPLMENFISCAV